MQRTASITFHVVANCEACSHQFDYDVTLSNTTTTGFFFCADPTTGLMKKIEDGNFGVHRCPSCGYLQSWMAKQWKDRWEMAAFVASLPFFFIVGKVIGWPWPDIDINTLWGDFILLCTLGAYLALVFLIFAPFYLLSNLLTDNPNRRWQKKHGPWQPLPKSPLIVPK